MCRLQGKEATRGLSVVRAQPPQQLVQSGPWCACGSAQQFQNAARTSCGVAKRLGTGGLLANTVWCHASSLTSVSLCFSKLSRLLSDRFPSFPFFRSKLLSSRQICQRVLGLTSLSVRLGLWFLKFICVTHGSLQVSRPRATRAFRITYIWWSYE